MGATTKPARRWHERLAAPAAVAAGAAVIAAVLLAVGVGGPGLLAELRPLDESGGVALAVAMLLASVGLIRAALTRRTCVPAALFLVAVALIFLALLSINL